MKISKQVRERLLSNNWTISTAESCSGGLLSHIITNSSGSSNYFSNGYITYSDEVKISELNIPREIVEKYSSYSGEVVELMAKGVREKTNSTFGLATTGIAPPGDPSTSLKTGTVFIGVSILNNTKHYKFYLRKRSRLRFKKKTVKLSIHILEKLILKYS